MKEREKRTAKLYSNLISFWYIIALLIAHIDNARTYCICTLTGCKLHFEIKLALLIFLEKPDDSKQASQRGTEIIGPSNQTDLKRACSSARALSSRPITESSPEHQSFRCGISASSWTHWCTCLWTLWMQLEVKSDSTYGSAYLCANQIKRADAMNHFFFLHVHQRKNTKWQGGGLRSRFLFAQLRSDPAISFVCALSTVFWVLSS